MERKTLLNATVVGTIAQLAMIGAGHFIPMVRDDVFAIGGMLISLIAGAYYAWLARSGLGDSLLGGAIAGGACALLGILASAALGDTPMIVVAFGTVASTVAGVLGGAAGRSLSRLAPQPTDPR